MAIRILNVVGARPNFMKIAPIAHAIAKRPERFDSLLLHTGQHYDEAMKTSFFQQLNIPEPDIDLGVGSGSHAVQTAEIMKRFEPIVDDWKPDYVLVVGDVNSTIACALVVAKKGIPLIHVEAGLRSYDRGMPEEINRVLTDQLSDLLFTTEEAGEENLRREGIDTDRVHFVGNVMIDTLLSNRARATPGEKTLRDHANEDCLGALLNGYGLVTMHRPSNVDDPDVLRRLLETLVEISGTLPLVFPVHPRTRAQIESNGFVEIVGSGNILMIPPLGYLELLGLMQEARIILTDSGGVQEESTALGVPCLTLRENTERPITVTEGTNTVVGTSTAKILAAFRDTMDRGGKAGRVPALWDGSAAERILDVIEMCHQRVAMRES